MSIDEQAFKEENIYTHGLPLDSMYNNNNDNSNNDIKTKSLTNKNIKCKPSGWTATSRFIVKTTSPTWVHCSLKKSSRHCIIVQTCTCDLVEICRYLDATWAHPAGRRHVPMRGPTVAMCVQPSGSMTLLRSKQVCPISYQHILIRIVD